MDTEPRDPHVSPADVPAQPEHPMMLTGHMIDGDVALMARCMIEELLQVGVPAQQLVAMTRDPNYQGLHHARRALGDAAMDELLTKTCARIGQHRHNTIERPGDTQSTTLTISAPRNSAPRNGGA